MGPPPVRGYWGQGRRAEVIPQAGARPVRIAGTAPTIIRGETEGAVAGGCGPRDDAGDARAYTN